MANDQGMRENTPEDFENFVKKLKPLVSFMKMQMMTEIGNPSYLASVFLYYTEELFKENFLAICHEGNDLVAGADYGDAFVKQMQVACDRMSESVEMLKKDNIKNGRFETKGVHDLKSHIVESENLSEKKDTN